MQLLLLYNHPNTTRSSDHSLGFAWYVNEPGMWMSAMMDACAVLLQGCGGPGQHRPHQHGMPSDAHLRPGRHRVRAQPAGHQHAHPRAHVCPRLRRGRVLCRAHDRCDASPIAFAFVGCAGGCWLLCCRPAACHHRSPIALNIDFGLLRPLEVLSCNIEVVYNAFVDEIVVSIRAFE